MSTWHTMRSRSPGGSSTVYRVHDNVMYAEQQPQHHYQQQQHPHHQQQMQTGIPIYAERDSYGYDTNVASQGGHAMYPSSQPQQQQQQPNVVYVHDVHSDDEDDDDAGSSSSSSDQETSVVADPNPQPRRKKLGWKSCNRTTGPCLTGSVLLALSCLVGYIFLIEALVDHSRSGKAFTIHDEGDHDQRGGSVPADALRGALRGAGGGGAMMTAAAAADARYYPSGGGDGGAVQYYVLQPVAMGPPSQVGQQQQPRGFPSQSANVIDETEGDGDNDVSLSSLSGSTPFRQHHYRPGADGPM